MCLQLAQKLEKDIIRGIVISTSNFQSGAIAYAKAHGIALIQMTEATEETFLTRSHYSVIVNHPYVPSNGGLPYIGVMIGSGIDDKGVTCSYLSPFSDKLEEFLLKGIGEV